MPKIIPESEFADTPLVNNLLKEMRKRRMSPRALGMSAGMSGDAVRNILRGRSASPREATVRQLAEALGVPVASLLYGAVRSEDSPPEVRIGNRDPRPARDFPVPEYVLRRPKSPVIQELPAVGEWKFPIEFLQDVGAYAGSLAWVELTDDLEPYERGQKLLVDLQAHPRPGRFLVWSGWDFRVSNFEPGQDSEHLLVAGTERPVDGLKIIGQIVGVFSFV